MRRGNYGFRSLTGRDGHLERPGFLLALPATMNFAGLEQYRHPSTNENCGRRAVGAISPVIPIAD